MGRLTQKRKKHRTKRGAKGLVAELTQPTRKTKGGAYHTPIRILPENFSVRFINAHGDISPEIFYVIPDKTYIIMPNVCGVSTSLSQTFTDPLYLAPNEAFDSFKNRFTLPKESNGRQLYTVYVPGDIIPMQTCLFDPTLPFTKEHLLVGFVGVFGPGQFFNNSFIQKKVKYKNAGADNVLAIPWKEVNMFMFELLEHIRIYLGGLEKDRKGKPISAIYRIYKAVLDGIQGVTVPVRKSLEDDTRLVFSLGPLYHDMEIHEGRFDYKKIGAINYKKSMEAIRYLLPLIPENTFGENIAQLLLDNKDKKLTRMSINRIVEKTRDPSLDTFFVLNACRSLLESKNVGSEFNFGPTEVGATATATANTTISSNNKYKKIDMSKYSAALIEKMDTLTLENSSKPMANINMKKINELRAKKGLKPLIQNILTHGELYEIFRGVIEIPESGEEYVPMIDSIKTVLSELEGYAPREKVKATVNVASEAESARIIIARLSDEERKKEVERLERRRRTLLASLREIKTMKKGVGTAAAVAAEREERIAGLRKELAEIEFALGAGAGVAEAAGVTAAPV